MSCPHLRGDLPPLTSRIAALPIDERGYPIPFFVAYVDGKPEFRAADGKKWKLCVKERLCWVCGQPLGAHKAFPIGPMCSISRTTSEPPCHLDCAEWSVKGCPFLIKPQMVRRAHEELKETMAATGGGVSGVMIERNPGVTAIWVTKDFTLFPDQTGHALIRIGDPESVTWWSQGRLATRSEVEASIKSGLLRLLELCLDENDTKELNQSKAFIESLLPKE